MFFNPSKVEMNCHHINCFTFPLPFDLPLQCFTSSLIFIFTKAMAAVVPVCLSTYVVSVSIGFFPSCLTRRYWCSASFGEYIEEVYVAYEQHKLEATGLEEFQGQVKMGILKTSYKLRNWLSFS
ncbi:uncharacterized protein LOC132634252 isoform X1 [Lycium barbarum]|uniref:uncharacterized protein LOC132634252 isoform X1 n=1 Tax=Lycium barbarum TaxID=112863 RepID=UPI00293EC99B|nr:uncharacterized protein LOC132634252 isoform X1 [Lycium barbarum]